MRLEAGLYMLSEFGAKIRLEIDSETWQSVLYAALCRALSSFKTLEYLFLFLECSEITVSSTFSIPKHRFSSVNVQKSMFLGVIYADFTSF